MARSALTINEVVHGGLDLTAALAAANVDGHSIQNTGQEAIVVDNADASPINVTVITPLTRNNLAVADEVIVCAAGVQTIIGPWKDKQLYNQEDTTVDIDFSAVASIEVAAIRIPG